MYGSVVKLHAPVFLLNFSYGSSAKQYCSWRFRRTIEYYIIIICEKLEYTTNMTNKMPIISIAENKATVIHRIRGGKTKFDDRIWKRVKSERGGTTLYNLQTSAKSCMHHARVGIHIFRRITRT